MKSFSLTIVDGSVVENHGSPKAGYGFFDNKSMNEFWFAGTGKTISQSAEESELQGIKEALEAAKGNDCKYLILGVDSLNYIKTINGDEPSISWTLKQLVREIQLLVKKIEFCECIFVNRCFSTAADFLAKLATTENISPSIVLLGEQSCISVEDQNILMTLSKQQDVNSFVNFV